MPNLLKKIGVLLSLVIPFSGWAQVNIAPIATVTASSCNVGTCATFNNQNLGTCGQQQVWVSTANPPSLVPGINFIEWNWAIPYAVNEMTIHHGNQFMRVLTGATIQYWDGTAWVNHHTFSNLPMICSNTVSFPVISTNRMRITSFQMTGTGQTSNPNFREIEIFMTSVERNDAGVSHLLNENSLCIGNNNLNFRIQNFGVNTIDSVMLNWQVNGGTIQSQWVVASINSVINGAPPHSVDVSVGPATILSGANSILAWTSLPNDTVDVNPINDTLLTTLTPGISGNYTVNSLQPTAGNNFNSFTELALYLNTFGVCGPLVVDVVPGGNPYTERIVFNDIPGTSVINTITINGNGNTLTHDAPNSALRSTLTLDKVKHMSIDSLNIEATGNNFGWAMHLTNVSDSNSFTRCSFLSNDLNFEMGTSGVVISSSPTSDFGLGINGSNISFDRCLFSGGRYGLTANGIALNIMSQNLSITNSEFRNSSENGIRIRGFEKITIEANRITRENRTDARTYAGINLQNCEGSIKISKNRIYGLNSLNLVATGIILSNLGSTVNDPIEISNNLIYDLDNLQSTTGIDVVAGTSYHMKIHHNTIVLNNLKANLNIVVRAFRVSTVSFTCTFEFLNNLVVLGGNSNNNRVYLLTAASASVSNIDNNVYFRISNLSALIGTIQNTNYPNFTDWQAAGYDPNGAFTNPDFLGIVGQSDFYRPTNLSLLGMGTNLLSRVPDDIEGAARNSMPDPGAFNIITEQAPYDVGVAQLLYPDTVCGDSTILGVRIRNYGTEIIDSVMVSWQVNGGTIQSTWVSGPIDTVNSVAGPFLDVNVGPVNFPGASTNTLTTWTSLPNNQVDTITSNDTNNAIVISRLSGTVTINPNQPTGIGNFNSFTDFAQEVNTNGICGPVIVNVAPGSPTFTERIVFNQISGMSAVNTITINGNGNTLSHTAAFSLERTTLVLNGTDHLIINDLTIEATGASFAWVTQLYNTSDSNTFNNCHFKAPINQGSTGILAVVFSGSLTGNGVAGNNGNFNVFNGCTIEGGLAGVTLLGDQNQECLNNEFLNCTFINFFQHGIQAVMQRNFIVKNCDFSSPNINHTSAFTNFGAVFGTNINASIFYGNRIHNTNDPLSNNLQLGATGFALNPGGNSNNTDTSSILFANNLFYNFTNQNATYGISIGSEANNTIKIFHNTFAFEHPKTNQNIVVHGIHFGLNVTKFQIENNLFYLNSGSNNQRGLLLNQNLPPSPERIINYNTYFLFNNQGRIATVNNINYNTLIDWQATNNDLNGYFADPQFLRVTGTSEFYRPANSQMIGIGNNLFSQVPDDIEGAARTSSPDPGAFNIITNRAAFDAGINELVFPDTVCGDSTMLTLRITNFGSTVLDSVQVSWQTNGGAVQTEWVQGPIDTIGSLNSSSLTAVFGPTPLIPATANSLKAWTSLPNNQNDTVNSNDTLNTTIQTLLSGTVSINPNQPTGQGNYNSFTDFAQEVNTNGICGPVIVNVATGSPSFSERIVFNQISGMSDINTITINGNGNTLSHTASVSNQRATLLLNGTDHMTIDSLIVEATGANFGYAMQLTNQADSNTFFRCSFLVDENAVSVNFTPVVISGSLTLATAFGNNANFNIFENCTMNGGNSGVIMFGAPAIFNRGNVLRNNTIRNFSLNGIRVSHQEDLTLEYNDISRIDKNITNAFTGFAISNTRGTTRIYGNRIHGTRHPSSNANIGAIGISYSLNENLDSTNVTLIANNLLYNFNNRGITRGFRIFGNPVGNPFTQPVHVLHNTIVFEETAATLNTAVRAIEIFGNFANHTVANNLLYLQTGSNSQVGLFFNLTTPSVNRFLDYNTFYLHNNVGNIATLGNNNYNSLTQWQTTGNGINSVVADPLFQRNTGASDFYRPTSATIFGTGMNVMNKVPDDIELDIRPSLPDPGAFNIVICDSAPEIPHFADTNVLVCGSSDSIVVFLTPDSNATSYNWILPSGWSGNSNTDTILIWNINEHDSIYVYAENPCGLSDTLVIPIIRLNANLQASSLQICLGDTVNIGLLHQPNTTTDILWNIGGSTSSISVSPTENTTYTVTLSKDGNSCIDSIRIEVTIPDTILQTIQACDEYLWPADSLVYTTSGVYSTTLSAVNGCDSIVILDLTINQSDSTTLNVTECDTYFWNASGQTYNITGTYTATLSNQQGCDSVLILNLNILNSDSIVQMEVSCDSYFWPINNQTFDSSGVYTEIYTKSNGCDSTHVLILTINPSYSVSQNVVACDSFVWPANNQVYTLSGTYTDTLTTLSGCDSIVILNLTINQSSHTTETITACDVFVWNANNQSYNTSGTYTAILTNAVGCDSTITLNLSILQSDTISQTHSACDTYVWPVNNQSYSTSGVYLESFTKSNGCDSVIVLNLSIFSSSVTTQNIVACDFFTWPVNNQTYFASGTYIDTINSSAGCDSVINLELSINQSTTGNLNITACNSYIWPDNNQLYNTSGVYTATLVNSTGCDSVVTLYLQINTNDTISHQVVSCETYTWPVNNQTYTSTGVFQEVFTNAGGCDSVHILNLQIVQPDSVLRSQVACESYLWSETGITYNQSGTYSVTYTNFAGCDSVIILNLIVNAGVQIHQEVSACDSYVWPINGQTYTQSGTFSRSYTSSSGCDSIIHLHLSIFPSENTVQNVTASVLYFWAVNGRSYNRSGIYQHVLQTRNGCDSTIILDLTIQEGSVLYVPSAFTPDGNRLNEEFKISGNDIATFHIHIFNRFGQLIFESDDINRSWDGTHFGQLVPLGVYVYQITYTNTQGALYTRKGTVTVLR